MATANGEATMSGYAEFTAAAIKAARETGAILREALGEARQIAFKGQVDLVTEMDKRSEALIVGQLTAQFPDHLVTAEEGSGPRTGDSSYRWLIDPLDGTTNYAHGHPCFAVSIALREGDRTIVGVVYDPTRDELFRAELGGGAFLNDQPIHVSDIDELIRAMLATGFPYNAAVRHVALAHWHAFSYAAQAIRRDGSAAIDLCSVACGRFDGFYESHLGAWDCGAGALIAAEAGATVTDYNGDPFDPFVGQVVVSNGHLHEAILRVLAETPIPEPQQG
jgi:myo-inositol-1(or 4)-monophosphatase